MKRILILAGIGLAASTVGASAQEGIFMRDALSTLGIIAPERPAIEYRERPPLVVPPRVELRPPADRAALEASGQWPVDQDVTRERRRQREAAIPETERERRRMNDENPRVSIDEIRAGRRPGAGVSGEPAPNRPDSGREATWIDPRVLRSQGVKPDDAAAPGGEPARRALTDPPTGLRSPDPRAPMRATRDPRLTEVEEADPNFFNRQQAERNRR